MAIDSEIPSAFAVRRCKAKFVTPAKPSPHERKLLSDIDDQQSLRFQVPYNQFYRFDPAMQGKDPVKIIRRRSKKTLVFYYPFAGRLREGVNGKLIVDCTGEGVLFIEADADLTVEQFGAALHPPFPFFDELLYNVPGSDETLNYPLLLIQVTRLKCGSFIFAIRFNHVICDGTGIKQFMFDMGEIARGASSCSISSVWEKHLFDAEDPPLVTFKHHEYDEVEATAAATWPSDNLVQRSFFFGPDEVSVLRMLLPTHLHNFTKFELLTACLWRCRTIALNLDPDEKVRMLCAANLRPRSNPSLPSGYYGNAFVFPSEITTVGKLVRNPLGYAVELVKQVKANTKMEYPKSVAALMVSRGKQLHLPNVMGSYIISDLTKMGYEEVDFGWGKAVFAGPAKALGVISFFIESKC
ncbi:Benzyl alcohol O-benzoyltransferase [Hibiscus syriacus]|uniref:Benzyl alcohol O-benzoyltransferase n=1 Tax=Hibiscus syriacus TaxID=106335 RepID=A0A6A3AT56_HIBSY|nr:Benzyl alcohol O-benzoyltransferase [Hibiscus syriacus]